MILSFLDITDAEIFTIRWHMVAWGFNQNSFEEVRNYDTTRTLYPLVMIILVADELATRIMERSARQLDEQ